MARPYWSSKDALKAFYAPMSSASCNAALLDRPDGSTPPTAPYVPDVAVGEWGYKTDEVQAVLAEPPAEMPTLVDEIVLVQGVGDPAGGGARPAACPVTNGP